MENRSFRVYKDALLQIEITLSLPSCKISHCSITHVQKPGNYRLCPQHQHIGGILLLISNPFSGVRFHQIRILFLGIMYSCSNEDMEYSENQNAEEVGLVSSEKVLNRILSLGVSKENIVEYNDYYLVEGDIVFPKDDSIFSDESTLRQARTKNLVTRKGIQVYLKANFSDINTNISIALDCALSAYNALNPSLALFRTTDQSQADIIISCDNTLGTDVCGRGGFPYSNGDPYNKVLIQETTLLEHSITSISQLQFLLVHELGHNVGLRHTNWADGEIAGSYGAIQIAGTPQTDDSSVMNSSTGGYYWLGFSYYDKIAILTIYPTDITCGFDLNESVDQSISLDYNGDGFGDLLFYRPGAKSVFLNRSLGNGLFHTVYQSGKGLASYDFNESVDQAISLDYNGDGKDDIMCYRPGKKTVFLLKSNGDGSFTCVYGQSGIGGFDFNESVDKAIALDYNGDGFDDILCTRPGEKIVYLLKSNGAGSYVCVYASTNGIADFDFNETVDKAIALDYNHDGLSDLVLYRPGFSVAYSAHSNGASFVRDYP
jgi:hypothetical protein